MYANVMGNCSMDLLHVLFEIDKYINRELIQNDEIAMRYVDVSCNIIKKSINLKEQEKTFTVDKLKMEIKNLEEKYNHIENSASFKIGRALTSVPRKIRDTMKH